MTKHSPSMDVFAVLSEQSCICTVSSAGRPPQLVLVQEGLVEIPDTQTTQTARSTGTVEDAWAPHSLPPWSSQPSLAYCGSHTNEDPGSRNVLPGTLTTQPNSKSKQIVKDAHESSSGHSPRPHLLLHVPCCDVSSVHRPPHRQARHVLHTQHLVAHQQRPLALDAGSAVGEHPAGVCLQLAVTIHSD